MRLRRRTDHPTPEDVSEETTSADATTEAPPAEAASAETSAEMEIEETPAGDSPAEPEEAVEPVARPPRRGRTLLRVLVLLPALVIVGLTAATIALRSNGPLPPSLLPASSPQPFLVRAWELAQSSADKHGYPTPQALAKQLSSELGTRVVAGPCTAASRPAVALVVDTAESTPDTLVLYTKGGQGLVAGYGMPQPSLFESHACNPSPFASYAAAVLYDSPQAYWLLDRVDQRLRTHDLTGHDLRLRYQGAGLKRVPELGGYATFFNGSDAYLDGGRAFDFPQLEPFSVELWANPSDQGKSYHCLVSRQTTSERPEGYTLWLRSGQGLGFNRYGHGRLNTVIDKQGIPSGRWSYLDAVYDGQALLLYVDGRLVGRTIAPAVTQSSDAAFRVGSGSSAGCYYSGGLARLAVYGYALTPTMIARHYALATAATSKAAPQATTSSTTATATSTTTK